MKNLIIIGLCMVSGICLADRVDTWLASTVVVSEVDLVATASGGCTARATGSVTTSLGKTITVQTAPVAVSGANLTECLDILNTKGPAIFKADQNL